MPGPTCEQLTRDVPPEMNAFLRDPARSRLSTGTCVAAPLRLTHAPTSTRSALDAMFAAIKLRPE